MKWVQIWLWGQVLAATSCGFQNRIKQCVSTASFLSNFYISLAASVGRRRWNNEAMIASKLSKQFWWRLPPATLIQLERFKCHTFAASPAHWNHPWRQGHGGPSINSKLRPFIWDWTLNHVHACNRNIRNAGKGAQEWSERRMQKHLKAFPCTQGG